MSVNDLMHEARNAYSSGDAQRSKQVHDAKLSLLAQNGSPEQHQIAAGGYLKSVIYGGLDGIITTFATVTSVAGANLNTTVILILGIAHLFADGISMGIGDYLSSQAEVEYNTQERKREEWELDNFPEGERSEMVELYRSKGISEADAVQVVNILSKYRDAFLDIMMVEELGLMPVDENDSPAKNGLVTLLSFMLFGAVPLVSYLFNLIPGVDLSEEQMLIGAIVLTVATLFLLGALKGKFVGNPWWKSGTMVALYGSFAAAVSYLVGYVLGQVAGIEM